MLYTSLSSAAWVPSPHSTIYAQYSGLSSAAWEPSPHSIIYALFRHLICSLGAFSTQHNICFIQASHLQPGCLLNTAYFMLYQASPLQPVCLLHTAKYMLYPGLSSAAWMPSPHSIIYALFRPLICGLCAFSTQHNLCFIQASHLLLGCLLHTA